MNNLNQNEIEIESNLNLDNLNEPLNNSTSTRVKLKCNQCDYTTVRKYFLDKHLSQKHSSDSINQKQDTKNFECELCDKKFKDIATLNNHRNLHFGLKPYQCGACQDSFGTKGELTRHIKYKHTLEKPHKCTECEYSTVELSKLRRHMRVHTDERPYLCGFCDYASRDTFKLKRHLRTHTGEKPYECPICKNRFSQSNSLKSHIKAYHKEVPTVLDETGLPIKYENNEILKRKRRPYKQRKLKVFRQLEDEILEEQNNNQEAEDELASEEDINNVSSSSKASNSSLIKKESGILSTFIVTDQNELNNKKNELDDLWFTCDICFMRFLTKDLLEEHIVKHTGDRPFECEICGIKFSHKFALKAHLLSHDANYNEKIKQTLSSASQLTKNRFLHKKKKPVESNSSQISPNISNLNESSIEQNRINLINTCPSLNNSIFDILDNDVKDTLDYIIDRVCSKLEPVLIDLTYEEETEEKITNNIISLKPLNPYLNTPPAPQQPSILISPIISLNQSGISIESQTPPKKIELQSEISKLARRVQTSPNIFVQEKSLIFKTPEKNSKLESNVKKTPTSKKDKLDEMLNKSIQDSIEKAITVDSDKEKKVQQTIQFRCGQRKRLIQSAENSFVIMNDDDYKSPKKNLNTSLNEPFKCSHCDKTYDAEPQLEKHMRVMHKKEKKSIDNLETEDFLNHLNTTISKSCESINALSDSNENILNEKNFKSESNLSIYDKKVGDLEVNKVVLIEIKKLKRSKSNLEASKTNIQSDEPKYKLRKK